MVGVAARLDMVRTLLEKVPTCGRCLTDAVDGLQEEGVDVHRLRPTAGFEMPSDGVAGTQGRYMTSFDGLPHRPLRSYAAFLVGLGWSCVVVCTLAGFVPWFVVGSPAVPVEPTWLAWLVYAAPALGLLVGALVGLGCFVASGVIRVLLDQRDLLDELLMQHRSGRAGAAAQPGAPSASQDLFDLTGIKDRDNPSL